MVKITNLPQWIAENEENFQPPVCNRMLYVEKNCINEKRRKKNFFFYPKQLIHLYVKFTFVIIFSSFLTKVAISNLRYFL